MNTHNTITKTHTHTFLKAADFGFRTKKKGQAYNASIQSRKSQRLYNHAKHPLTQPPVIPAGKRIALSNTLIAPEWNFTLQGLAYINKEGLDAITTIIHELERAGYITRNRIRDEKGLLREMEYTSILPQS